MTEPMVYVVMNPALLRSSFTHHSQARVYSTLTGTRPLITDRFHKVRRVVCSCGCNSAPCCQSSLHSRFLPTTKPCKFNHPNEKRFLTRRVFLTQNRYCKNSLVLPCNFLKSGGVIQRRHTDDEP